MAPSRSLTRLVSINCVTCAAMALRSISSCFFWLSSRSRSTFSACDCWTSNWASSTLAGAPRLVFCFCLLYWLCLTCCALFLSTRPLFLSCSNNEFPMGCAPTVNANLRVTVLITRCVLNADETHVGDLGFTDIGQAEGRLPSSCITPRLPPTGQPVLRQQRLSSRLANDPATSSQKVESDLFNLANVQQFHIEYQGRVRRDHAACAARSVGKIRGNDQGPLATDFHAHHALVPSLDDAACAEGKLERHAAITGAVEFLSFMVGRGRVVKPTGIVHRNIHSGRRLRALAHDPVRLRHLCHVTYLHTGLHIGTGCFGFGTTAHRGDDRSQRDGKRNEKNAFHHLLTTFQSMNKKKNRKTDRAKKAQDDKHALTPPVIQT